MSNHNNSDLSDSQLMELSKEDPDVFSALVERYQCQLFCYVKRISYFIAEDIEDIIQEVFIKVYKNLNNFDTHLKFSSWVYQITRNATIDAIRKKQVRPQSAQMEEEDLVKIFRSSTDIEKETISKDSLSNVKNIIDGLPFKYKEVMILRFLEEKDYEEIMDILKKPKGTVATLINRGRKMISQEIEKQCSS